MLKFLRKLYYGERFVACAALAVMILVNVANTLRRYLFDASIFGAEDLTQLCFCWLTFLGASICYEQGLHYGMEFVTDKLSGKVKSWWLFGIDVIILALSLFLTYQSVLLCISVTTKVTGALSINYVYINSAAAVGFGYMALHAVEKIYLQFKSIKTKSPADAAEGGANV